MWNIFDFIFRWTLKYTSYCATGYNESHIKCFNLAWYFRFFCWFEKTFRIKMENKSTRKSWIILNSMFARCLRNRQNAINKFSGRSARVSVHKEGRINNFCCHGSITMHVRARSNVETLQWLITYEIHWKSVYKLVSFE